MAAAAKRRNPRDSGGLRRGGGGPGETERPLPDSNRGWRICNPLPYHLAKGPGEDECSGVLGSCQCDPAGYGGRGTTRFSRHPSVAVLAFFIDENRPRKERGPIQRPFSL